MPSRRFLNPPVPVAVELGNRDAVVTFDQALLVQPISPGNWLLHLDPPGVLVADSADVIVPNQVALGFSVSAEAVSLEYLATPPDVEGTNGLDVQAFVFPLV